MLKRSRDIVSTGGYLEVQRSILYDRLCEHVKAVVIVEERGSGRAERKACLEGRFLHAPAARGAAKSGIDGLEYSIRIKEAYPFRMNFRSYDSRGNFTGVCHVP